MSGYDAPAIARWAEYVRAALETRSALVFFDNDVKVRAPYDALALAEAVGG
ncbi:hypothetical protein GCM10025868_44040 [Angustibacter aerolatus]|uniref:DUF72 domain-containing protein n=1 Tax=Angustibacter aerolatus TaxID=1162965 RepID=A0ABQ6JPA0_9ACTN|nr:hypothetical protein GCM10025868_44040 [Angustibacter aerolatus]